MEVAEGHCMFFMVVGWCFEMIFGLTVLVSVSFDGLLLCLFVFVLCRAFL